MVLTPRPAYLDDVSAAGSGDSHGLERVERGSLPALAPHLLERVVLDRVAHRLHARRKWRCGLLGRRLGLRRGRSDLLPRRHAAEHATALQRP